MPRVIDTHCHLTFPEYEGRVDQVLADARAVGVVGAITIATTTTDAVRALALAQAHEHLWSSAGVHPLYAEKPADWAQMRSVGLDRKCVAWGELGLDRHHTQPPFQTQLTVLEAQLAEIESLERAGMTKPIILHCRDAFSDLIPILKSSCLSSNRFVFHCFTAGPAEMRALLDFGAMVSFTGVLTYKNAKATQEAACLSPIDRVLVETDSPFLAPEPHRLTRPNAPRLVTHIADKLASLRGITPEAMRAQLALNCTAFFGI